MDFKFVSHGLWSEKKNILLQHMHKKKFLILTNRCGNKIKHENEAEELISTFNSKNPKFFFMHVLTKDVLLH
jgi:hemerythrin